MALQVYNTLSRKKEPFHKKPGDAVTMYVCGPTVYKPSHIGHMVGPVIFDTVKRYLTYLGYKVKWVVNITDVDDKLIKRAGELNTTVPVLAEQMTQDYFACLKALNVTGIDHFPRATQHIGGMIEVIQALRAKDIAYELDDGVYFDVSKDDDYGKLSNRNAEDMEAGARLEPNAKKRNPGDFALWKSKPGEPKEVQFDSPFKCGRGRPGWHIECTCMAVRELGETLDIHGGGLDLQFPHHENELAQSESWTGKPFARVWMHNGLLKLKSGKMAGSLGNVLNVADALKAVGGDVLRFFILGTHYRSPIDLGDWEPKPGSIPSGLESAKSALRSFYQFFDRYQELTGTSFYSLEGMTAKEFRESGDLGGEFMRLMDDDFNTGGAVGEMFRTLDQAKTAANRAPGDPSDLTRLARQLRTMANILGLFWAPPEEKTLGGGDALVAGLMQLLLDLRANLRASAKEAAKDNPLKKALFDQTDLIRKRLGELGVTLEDRPGGTTWRVG
jgi:cysteinyl-tRNA synthetase